ncbi:hypothetical protein C6558_38365 [Ensifer sp. NM-2]|nr:hypothetical protein C6558_38365 [Ensifer sp. NM-2]
MVGFLGESVDTIFWAIIRKTIVQLDSDIWTAQAFRYKLEIIMNIGNIRGWKFVWIVIKLEVVL